MQGPLEGSGSQRRRRCRPEGLGLSSPATPVRVPVCRYGPSLRAVGRIWAWRVLSSPSAGTLTPETGPNSPAAAPAALGPLQLGARGYTTHFQIFISALSCLTALSCRQQLQLRGKRGFVFLSLLTAQACRPCGQSVAWPCLGCSVPRGHSAVLSGLTHSLCKTGSDLCPATSQEGSRSGPWSPQHSPIAGDGAHCPVPTALGDGRPAPLTKRDFGRPGEIGSKTIFKTT